MNSAFLGYLITGNKPSTEGAVFCEAPFWEKIPPLNAWKRSKNIQFREIKLSAGKDALTLLHQNNPEVDFKWENIIGASTSSIPSTKFPSLNCPEKEIHILTIHFYAKRNEITGIKLQEIEREFYAFDLNTVLVWKNIILQLANNPQFVPADHTELSNIPSFRRVLLVFINPNSGTKKGIQVWEQAKCFLTKAGCTFVEVFTKAPNHARNYLLEHKASELKEIDGILSVSGDGIPHEIINGIFGRPDWELFKDLPIGALPGGSAGALMTNQLVRSGEQLNLASACYLVAKGRTIKSDLMVYEGAAERNVYGFLSFVYGMMGRLDIESERFRWIGNTRFYLYGVYEIAKLKPDRARITFSETIGQLPPLEEEIKGEEWKILEDSFAYLSLLNIPYLDMTSKGAPLADFDDGHMHFLYMKGEKISRKHLVSILTKLDTSIFVGDQPCPSTGLDFNKIKAFRFEALDGGYVVIDGEKYETNKVQGHVREKMLTVYCTK